MYDGDWGDLILKADFGNNNKDWFLWYQGKGVLTRLLLCVGAREKKALPFLKEKSGYVHGGRRSFSCSCCCRHWACPPPKLMKRKLKKKADY